MPKGPREQSDHGAIDNSGQGGAADRFAYLDGVVDPRQNLPDLAHLEKRQGQPQKVPSVPADQAEIDLAADMGQQVLPEHAEQSPEDNDEHHADAERVEQARLATGQHRVHQVLHEVGGGHPEHGHEQGTGGSFQQDGALAAEQG
jgi:hypothetical protein